MPPPALFFLPKNEERRFIFDPAQQKACSKIYLPVHHAAGWNECGPRHTHQLVICAPVPAVCAELDSPLALRPAGSRHLQPFASVLSGDLAQRRPLDLICMYDTVLWDLSCLLNNDMTLIGRVFLSRGSGEARQLLESIGRRSCCTLQLERENIEEAARSSQSSEGIEFEIFISIAAWLTNSVQDVSAFKLYHVWGILFVNSSCFF